MHGQFRNTKIACVWKSIFEQRDNCWVSFSKEIFYEDDTVSVSSYVSLLFTGRVYIQN